MSTLWVFGDSFGEDHEAEGLTDRQWHRTLARELGMHMENTCRSGTSLEWLYYKFYENRNRIKDGDLVVIILTEFSRRWFFHNRPKVSVIAPLLDGYYDSQISYKERKAVSFYCKHLAHQTYIDAQINNLMYSLQALVKDRNCRAIVLPAFPSSQEHVEKHIDDFPLIGIGRGHLNDITAKEFHDTAKFNQIWNNWRDRRSCHMMLENHQVLAAKLLSWYRDGSVIDLSTGFHEEILTYDLLYTTEPGIFFR